MTTTTRPARRAQQAVRPPRQFNLTDTARIAEAHRQARERVNTELAGVLPASTRDAQRAYGIALENITAAVSAAVDKVTAIENRADLYPQAKEEAAGKVLSDTDHAVRQHIADARTAVDVMRATLTVAAMPRMAGDPALARQDALMILDRTDPDKRTDTMRDLARRGGDVGALVTSDWGRDYLAATRGAHYANTAHNAIVGSAIEAAADSDDPDRSSAAHALQATAQMTGLADTAGAVWGRARTALTAGQEP